MINLLRYVGLALLFLITVLPTLHGQGAIPSTDYVTADIFKKSYWIALPLPFGRSEISIVLDDHKVDGVTIVAEKFTVAIPRELLEPLDLIGEPSVAFPDNGSSASDRIDEFTVTFETGDLYDVLIADSPGCGNPCKDRVRDIVTFTVSCDGEIESEVIDVGSVLERRDK